MEPACNDMGVFPKVFIILETTEYLSTLDNESFTVAPKYYDFEELKSEISFVQDIQNWNFNADSNIYVAILPEDGIFYGIQLIEIYRILNCSVVQAVAFSENFMGYTQEGLNSRNRRMDFYGQNVRAIIYVSGRISIE